LGPGRHSEAVGPPALGIGANAGQFALLVAISAFVGAMVGLERSVMPLLARDEFGVQSATAAVSFVASFGAAKAVTNLFAGAISERLGRRRVLIAGWLAGVPVPAILIWAPSWDWVIAANLLLGLNQGLAWSMTVNMKLDLAGPKQRGLALGLNESAGYLAVAATAYLSGVIADEYGLGPEPFYLGLAFAACGLALSVLFVRDTGHLVPTRPAAGPQLSLASAFRDASWRRRDLFALSQAGFVNNMNDALAWGIFPLLFAARGLSLERIGVLAAVYPLVWALLQVGTGWASDLFGRRPLIAGGMLLQAGAITLVAAAGGFTWWLAAVALLGAGTAMVYPTLLAGVSDAVPEQDRATTLGVYRFWRDAGAIAGALTAGAVADLLDFEAAILGVATLTALSGAIAAAALRGSDNSKRMRTLIVATVERR